MNKISVLIVMFFALSRLTYAQESPTKHIIEIKSMKFIPAEIYVKKGDTVVWKNKDFFPHDVAKFEDKSWKSSPIQQGETWSKVVTKSEDYFCSLHVVMKGKITLKD